jgi:hypothetical protein
MSIKISVKVVRLWSVRIAVMNPKISNITTSFDTTAFRIGHQLKIGCYLPTQTLCPSFFTAPSYGLSQPAEKSTGTTVWIESEIAEVTHNFHPLLFQDRIHDWTAFQTRIPRRRGKEVEGASLPKHWACNAHKAYPEHKLLADVAICASLSEGPKFLDPCDDREQYDIACFELQW